MKKILLLAMATCLMTSTGSMFCAYSSAGTELLKYALNQNIASQSDVDERITAINDALDFIKKDNADPNIRSDEGFTLLHYAIQTGKTAPVEGVLKISDIDVNAPGVGGLKPLDFLIEMYQNEDNPADQAVYKKIAEILERFGARTSQGKTMAESIKEAESKNIDDLGKALYSIS